MSSGWTSPSPPARLSALLVVLLCCAPPTADAAKRHKCHPRGSRTEASDARGQVYSVKANSYGERSFYGCLYRTGQRRPFAENPYDDYDHHVARVRLASPYVAYVVTDVSSQSNADTLSRLNLRHGRTRELDYLTHYSADCCIDWEVEELRRLLVTSFGAVAWSYDNASRNAPVGTVKKFDRTGPATLDSDPGVKPRTLHLNGSGHRVYWMNGRKRSARLR